MHAAWFVLGRQTACICSWIPGACGLRTTRQSGATDSRTGVGHDQLLGVTVPLGYVYVPSIERIPFGVWSPAERMLSGAPCMQAKMVCALYYVAWEGGGQEGTGRALHCRNGSLSSSMGQRLFVWNSAKKEEEEEEVVVGIRFLLFPSLAGIVSLFSFFICSALRSTASSFGFAFWLAPVPFLHGLLVPVLART
jgi:hypothetical protein